MPAADAAFTWTDGIVAFVVLASIAFLVSWLTTDIFHVARNAYIAILSLVVAVLTAAYLAWSGASGAELVTSNWRGGLVAGGLVTIAIVPMIRRLPARAHARGPRPLAMFAWEGVVYGTAEALLLAALPVLVVWDATGGVGRGGAWRGVLAIVGALVVILVHHLGYTEFRTIAARPKVLGALVSCGLQAGAFLLTGNVLAPIAAHIALHVTLILRGVEMPPVEPSDEAPPRVMLDREGLVTALPQARSSDGRR